MKVGKVILLVDFVLLNMKGDPAVPLILDKPFLATGGTLIDVQSGDLTFSVNGEEMKFNIYRTPTISTFPLCFIVFCACYSSLSVRLCAFQVFEKFQSKQKTVATRCSELIFTVARNHQFKEAVTTHYSEVPIHYSEHEGAS